MAKSVLAEVGPGASRPKPGVEPGVRPPEAQAPGDRRRRILLAVTGLSPQVVTETLYALACVRQPPWVPHEVHLVTTAAGKREAELNLLFGAAGQPGWFERLRRDYGLPPIAFDSACIHVLTGRDGQPLDDIRTPEDNECAADFINDVLRGLTCDPQTELHVSIAGGRKTMGYYLGYALSLYGRAQDRLSHVLVSEPFENNYGFFYPTPGPWPIVVARNGKEQTFDAREARVDLAEIPFVRLRDGLPPRLRTGKVPFSRVVEVANRAQEAPRLVLALGGATVCADGVDVALGRVPFCVLLWLAQRARRKLPAVDWGQAEAVQEFLSTSRQVMNQASGAYERIEKALAWRRNAAIKLAKYFEPHKARINRALAEALGERAAARYAIRRVRTAEGCRFELPLEPSQIRIEL